MYMYMCMCIYVYIWQMYKYFTQYIWQRDSSLQDVCLLASAQFLFCSLPDVLFWEIVQRKGAPTATRPGNTLRCKLRSNCEALLAAIEIVYSQKMSHFRNFLQSEIVSFQKLSTVRNCLQSKLSHFRNCLQSEIVWGRKFRSQKLSQVRHGLKSDIV